MPASEKPPVLETRPQASEPFGVLTLRVGAWQPTRAPPAEQFSCRIFCISGHPFDKRAMGFRLLQAF
jgi:hypothetical protein